MKIVSFLWGNQYSADHVNKLCRSVKRNLHIPHEFIVITDRNETFIPEVKVLPLWDKCKSLGRCFNRLYVFHPAMHSFIGPRFACIDLDCIITGDITPLIDRPDDFIINSYQPSQHGWSAACQQYNGSMFMMNAGARAQVWDKFNPILSPEIIARNETIVGSDQAWIRHILGPDENRWDAADGIYEARNIGGNLPENARIVFFSGSRDPSTYPHEWARSRYDRS